MRACPSLRHALAAGGFAALLVAALPAGAADLPQDYVPGPTVVPYCAQPPERVILFDRWGRPTVPARTPYYYCVTGRTLFAGDIPPPPEYCCRT